MDLVEAIGQKWAFRGRALANLRNEFLAKEIRYRRLWKPRLAAQITSLPEFVQVYRTVQRALRQAGLLGS